MLTQEEARASLAEWAAMMRQRDDRVMAALGSGVTVSEVSRLLDMSRPTVYAIIDRRAARLLAELRNSQKGGEERWPGPVR